jgi:CBS domain-containing membrane protein
MSERVSDLMSKNVTTLDAHQELSSADQLMKLLHIRHLPVVDRDNKVVGIVTARDILRVQAELITKLRPESEGEQFVSIEVGEIMSKDVQTLAPTMPASLAAKELLDHRYGCLPVTEDGRLVGIVTEADFLRWFVDRGMRSDD